MSYKLATAYVDIQARMAGLQGQFSKVQGMASSMMSGLQSLAGMFGIGLGLTAAVTAARSFIASAQEAYESEKRLAAVIKATGSAAGFTADEILKLSTVMSETTNFGDEAITDAASKLLTFKSVVGDTFERALKLSADLSATGFGSIQGSAVQLGKALEDPIRGLNSLRRAGVSFTEDQKKVIKSLVETGQLLKAQNIILDAVAGQVGGVAEATADPLTVAKNIIGNVGEEFGKRLYPIAVEFLKISQGIAQAGLKIFDAYLAVNKALGGWLTPIIPIYRFVTDIAARIAAIPVVQATWTAMVEKLQYAWARLQQAIDATARLITTAFSGVLSWLSSTFGITFASIEESIFNTFLGLIEMVGELAADTAEWALVIVQHWDTAQQALIAGIKFLGGFALDFLIHSFTAPIKIFIDAAYRAFSAIPELIKAALAGGLEGLAMELGLQVAAGISEAMATATDVKLSDFTKGAAKDFAIATGKLSKAKDELEKSRGEFMRKPIVVDVAKPAKLPPQKILHELDIKGGLVGLTQAWSQLQEAMLKRESPEEKMADGIGNIEDINDKMLEELIDLNADGVKLKGVAIA